MITLYGHELSGNVYKVRLLLELLGTEYEFVKVDLMKGEHKKPPYLAINPFGQVPALVDGDETVLDAQAILVYLAKKYGSEDWLPTDAVSLSKVVRWLSTTAGEVRQGVESARLYHLFKMKTLNIERTEEKANLILKQLDEHLADQEWLEFGRPTIADIAVFPYVALAPDGNISLDAYPNVLSWIDRIKHLPNFVGMRSIDAPVSA
ncbi:Glutathione S-transferase domain protein [[Leptolyngbya] sp. PCC 7376]|uniref:glutathione S-transferase family protein n=1 Tax=[Leptolyngbya] sp. PCC 7376 TaxID=111781 RepID=UPI00029F1053|nr:glutathione S-transferase family protein [[Leptolyngbya] sp. PCC 7376]AFY39235.1 Glutathione S-transferase domain protein [[Leptolyngbya] sp. PCC 7376]